MTSVRLQQLLINKLESIGDSKRPPGQRVAPVRVSR